MVRKTQMGQALSVDYAKGRSQQQEGMCSWMSVRLSLDKLATKLAITERSSDYPGNFNRSNSINPSHNSAHAW